jgi:hypothetical protein
LAGVAAVIPAMDKIADRLNRRSKAVYHPAIQAAMKVAAAKIDQYYGCTDSSSVYRIAMGNSIILFMITSNENFSVLHPGLKLDYFRAHKWKNEWIEVAEDMVRDEYKTHYKSMDRDTDDKSDDMEVSYHGLNCNY